MISKRGCPRSFHKNAEHANAEEIFESLYYDWEIVLSLDLDSYLPLVSKKEHIESRITDCLGLLRHDKYNAIYMLRIEPIVKRFLRWKAILPTTKAEAFALIREERDDLLATATSSS
ncbi:MAG: hypothetical protein IKG21_12050 [Atopobiaceae bacterium]|nr:hypothetical protein [Atopobiaceae bacterium]